MELHEINRKLNIFLFRLDTGARVRLWRKLGKLLGDGISIIVALEELKATRKPTDAMHIALDEWVSILKNGRKFSDAVRDWVPNEEAMLLMAGDQSGTLAKTMQSVVEVSKAKKAIVGAIVGGLAYPTFLMVLSFAVLYLMSYKIIPSFQAAAPGDRWTGLARFAIDASGFVQNWFFVFTAFVVALVVAVIASMPLWKGKLRSSFDRAPPYSIYRVMQGSAWIISMSALIEAGMRIETAMEELMKNAAPWARERMAAALVGLRSGMNLGVALSATKTGFPDEEIISDIRIYFGKTDFDRALKLIGDEWIKESVEKIDGLMRIIFGVALLMVAAVLGFTMMGLFSIQMQLVQR